MNCNCRRTVAIVLLLAIFVVLPGTALPSEGIVIGTGSTAGVYYHAGRAICRTVTRAQTGLSCAALSTPGSLFNLSNVHGGALELGIAQSDWQYHAVKGTGPLEFADGRYDDLRAVFSLHGEPFTLVARRDSGIVTLDGLPGRRVNIGNPGSGQRATMEVVMAAKGWKKRDFLLALELPADQQSLALCHDRVDAMVYTVGHPNASVSKAAGLCDAVMIDVSGPDIDELIARNPYYVHAQIPGGIYSGNPDPVRTFGVKATLVTSARVSADLIYLIVKAVFENLDRLRRMHPAFSGLEPERMIKDGLSAPLHEGALRYYREQGLL